MTAKSSRTDPRTTGPSLATQEGVSSMALSDYPHANCAICAKWGPVDQQSRCPVCLSAAVDRAALLDDLDMAILGLIALGVNEIQLRCALIMAIDGKEGTLYHDFVERRRDGDGFVWHVPTSFVE
jgi:hypothetical protein